MKHFSGWLVAVLTLLLVSSSTLAQEETTSNTNTQVVYANKDRTFYVPIPDGWENLSTDNFAHFSREGQDIYALSLHTTDLEVGVVEAMKLVDVDTTTSPDPLSVIETVTVSGENWTQYTYSVDRSQFKAVGIVKNDQTFVIVVNRSWSDAEFREILVGFRFTPPTFPYLVMGLAAAAVIVGGFLLSMLLRYWSFQKDIETLQQLQQEGV